MCLPNGLKNTRFRLFESTFGEVIKEDLKITEIAMENGTSLSKEKYLWIVVMKEIYWRNQVLVILLDENQMQRIKEIYNGIQFGAPHHKFEKWIDPYVVEGEPKVVYCRELRKMILRN